VTHGCTDNLLHVRVCAVKASHSKQKSCGRKLYDGTHDRWYTTMIHKETIRCCTLSTLPLFHLESTLGADPWFFPPGSKNPRL